MIKKIIANSIILGAIVSGLFLIVLFLQPFHTVKHFMDWLSTDGASSFTDTYYQANSILLKGLLNLIRRVFNTILYNEKKYSNNIKFLFILVTNHCIV